MAQRRLPSPRLSNTCSEMSTRTKPVPKVLGRYRSAIGNYVETILVRLEPEAADAVRKWAKRKCISRSEALRRLIDLGLAAAQPMKRAREPPRGPPRWRAVKSTSSSIQDCPSKNGKRGNGVSSKGPKSFGICAATSLKLVKADLTTAAHFNARVHPRHRLVGD
jgi:hypothetical protein